MLELCVNHVIADSTFRPGGYRAGEVSGHDMPKLIEALFMVNIEGQPSRPLRKRRLVRDRPGHADGHSLGDSHRTVNLRHVEIFALCQRAGTAYPLDHFIQQVRAILAKLDNAKGNWVGTSLPARTAVVVQRLATPFPATARSGLGSAAIFDVLIDLGDREAPCTRTTEAFKGVQVRSSMTIS